MWGLGKEACVYVLYASSFEYVISMILANASLSDIYTKNKEDIKKKTKNPND